MKKGLVLEGGGMRGLYTTGVLDSFLDHGITFDYVIGVSAGACHAASYISNQRGRSFKVNTDYLDDKRYLSFSNYIKTKSLFGMDLIFDEIPNKLNLFDYDKFLSSPCEFKIGTTDVLTGKPVYFEKGEVNRDCTVLKASSSIPIFAPIVNYKDGKFVDGGTSDPIPVKKALEDGCDKVVVVLTRHRDYEKGTEKFRRIYKHALNKYPNLISTLDVRHEIYNDTTRYIKKLEAQGKALVVAPEQPLTVGRFEKKKEKLLGIYHLGIKDAEKKAGEIEGFF